MTDDQEQQLAYRIRQGLNECTEVIDERVLARLKQNRLEAISKHSEAVKLLSLSTVTGNVSVAVHPLRMALMAMALSLGLVGTYYWQQFDQAAENEEIDSALLADELPPEIYTDRGFHQWLEYSSPSVSQ